MLSKNLEDLGFYPNSKNRPRESSRTKSVFAVLVSQTLAPKLQRRSRKPKREDGKRRLKVSPHLVVSQRAWVKEERVYDYVKKIRLVGKWLRSTGFESGQYVVISAKKGTLIIEIGND